MTGPYVELVVILQQQRPLGRVQWWSVGLWLDEHPILHVSSWWFVVQRRLSPVSPASRVFPGRAYRSSNLRTSATSPPCFAISTWKRTFEHVCDALKGRNPNHRNNAVHCEAADLTPPPPRWEFLLSERGGGRERSPSAPPSGRLGVSSLREKGEPPYPRKGLGRRKGPAWCTSEGSGRWVAWMQRKRAIPRVSLHRRIRFATLLLNHCERNHSRRFRDAIDSLL